MGRTVAAVKNQKPFIRSPASNFVPELDGLSVTVAPSELGGLAELVGTFELVGDPGLAESSSGFVESSEPVDPPGVVVISSGTLDPVLMFCPAVIQMSLVSDHLLFDSTMASFAQTVVRTAKALLTMKS